MLSAVRLWYNTVCKCSALSVSKIDRNDRRYLRSEAAELFQKKKVPFTSGGSILVKANLRTIRRVNPTVRGFRPALSVMLVAEDPTAVRRSLTSKKRLTLDKKPTFYSGKGPGSCCLHW